MDGWVEGCSPRLAGRSPRFLGKRGFRWFSLGRFFGAFRNRFVTSGGRSIDRSGAGLAAVVGGLDAIDNEISGTSGKKQGLLAPIMLRRYDAQIKGRR